MQFVIFTFTNVSVIREKFGSEINWLSFICLIVLQRLKGKFN